MKKLIALLACLAPERPALDYATLSCFGDGPRLVVYLHGLDSERPSAQEIDNRKWLVAWARSAHARVAFPRAKRRWPRSPEGLVCWGTTFTPAEREDIAVAIEDAADACLGPNGRYGVIGFSNGGYAVGDLVANAELGRLSRVEWAVTIGASTLLGPWPGPSLAREPPVVMLTGEQDETGVDPTDNYATQLRARGATVVSIHYPGTHRVRGAPLDDALRRLP